MSHLPTIITDLAMILLVAGVTTILFKKINQPLVLGYIIAGFITGPNFVFFPTIADKVNVQAWSEIGVIFLSVVIPVMFRFGVEKGRLLIIAIALIPSLLAVMITGMLESSGVPMPSGDVLQAIFYSSPLFTLAVFLVSFRISVGICRKKEY